MNYAEMSKREINVRLHALIVCRDKAKFTGIKGNYTFWIVDGKEVTAKYDPREIANYSGDISVLWPLMIEHKIAVTPLTDCPGKFSADRVVEVNDIDFDEDCFLVESDICYQDYDPLKAACFVLLMALGDE